MWFGRGYDAACEIGAAMGAVWAGERTDRWWIESSAEQTPRNVEWPGEAGAGGEIAGVATC